MSMADQLQGPMTTSSQLGNPLGLTTHTDFIKFRKFILFLEDIGYSGKVNMRNITYENMIGLLNKLCQDID